MTIPEILAALERFGGTARPTEPGLLVLTLPAETTRERLDEVVDAVCAMGLPADQRVGVTRASGDEETLARALVALIDRLLWIAYAAPPMTERQLDLARQKARGDLDRWFRWPG